MYIMVQQSGAVKEGVLQRRSWRVPLLRVMQEQPALSRELVWTQKAGLEDAIRLKVSYALNRWAEDENCSGTERKVSSTGNRHCGCWSLWYRPLPGRNTGGEWKRTESKQSSTITPTTSSIRGIRCVRPGEGVVVFP